MRLSPIALGALSLAHYGSAASGVAERHRLHLVLLLASPFALLPTTATRNIVFLGDSYASGNGARSSEWSLGDNNPENSYNYEGVEGCFRSPTSWASQVAEGVGATSYFNRACSSGSTAHVATSPRDMGTVSKVNGQCPTSPNAPEEYYVSINSNSCKRFLQTQITAVNENTDAVILAVGGNDFQFENMVKQCFVPNYRSEADCQRQMNFANGAVAGYTTSLTQLLGDIKQVLNPTAKVIVVTYPHIVQFDDPAYHCCWWEDDDLDVTTPMRALGESLDDAQRSAVNAANANAGGEFAYLFDDTKALFKGHEPDPDSTVYNPERWVFELFNQKRAEWWHLNPIGHAQLGNAITTYLDPLLPAVPTASPTPAPSPAPPDCFSAANTVEVEGKGTIKMDSLRIGDMVRSDIGFSKVYSFLHLAPTEESPFRSIHVEGLEHEPLEITNTHILYLSGGNPVRAMDVKVGDQLLLADTEVSGTVTKIDEIVRAGLYAPTTYSGKIVVSGVVASNYVTTLYTLPAVSHDKGSHAFMASRRILCTWNFKFCEDETYTSEGIADSVAWAKKFIRVVNTQPLILQSCVMILIFLCLVTLSTMGQLSNMFFVTMATLLVWFLVLRKKQSRNAKSL